MGDTEIQVRIHCHNRIDDPVGEVLMDLDGELVSTKNFNIFSTWLMSSGSNLLPML